jgi:hypothetical protein
VDCADLRPGRRAFGCSPTERIAAVRGRNLFFQLVSGRYDRVGLIVTSNR